MNFLIVRSVFCPNDEFYKISIDALLNLFDFLEYEDKNNINLDLFIVGWAKKNKYSCMISKMIDLKKYIFNNVIINMSPLNYGKYHIFNQIKDLELDKYDFILYSDHDILFPLVLLSKNVLMKMSGLFTNSINNKQIGLVAFNQLEDVRHQYDIYQNRIIINDITCVYPNDECFGSIADGCFMTSASVFDVINYFDLITVYGLDDYHLIKKIHDKNMMAVVLSNIYIVHPHNDNDKYNKWKKDRILELINNKPRKYYELIQESINFWNG